MYVFMGGVFHKMFVSFITFKIYKLKDSDLFCWKDESLRQAVM